MKIFFIALPNSIHTYRWINQLRDENYEIYLFPSYDNQWPIHNFKGVKVLNNYYWIFKILNKLYIKKYFIFLYKVLVLIRFKFDKDYYVKKLIKKIRKTKPDIIHTLETQGAGYLFFESLKRKNNNIPWLHTNWGSDIYIYGKIDEHKSKINNVLSSCDYYSCECERDIDLAIKNGFKGKYFQPYPNTGGFDLSHISNIRNMSVPTSQRRYILLKGYQGWAGRALFGLRALERCADILYDYKILIFSNTDALDIIIASKVFTNKTGIEIELIPVDTSHDEILKYQSRSRVYLGLSIGDAISTSLLESMAMGSFPIQSCTSCADEWIVNNETGIIVPPEDPEMIELAIRKAISNDSLVDEASNLNFKKIQDKANYQLLKHKTIQIYKFIINEKNI